MSGAGRWIVICGIGACVAAVVGVLAWRLALRDTASPLTVDAALAAYREAAATGNTPIPVGVYVYRTSGGEYVSALGGARHRYPPRSTITATEDPCGVRLHWAPLRERTSTWTVCLEGRPARLLQPRWEELHRFYGRDDRSVWECGAAPWLLRAGEPPVAYRCSDETTEQRGTVVLVGYETVPVGEAQVAVAHVRIRVRQTGQARGTLIEDRWLETDTGLPVRMTYRVRTVNSSAIGDVDFDERYRLDLLSLEPRR